MKSMLKNTLNGKDYIYVCDPDSNLGDAIESCIQFHAFLLGKQEQNKINAVQAVPANAVEVTETPNP